MSDYQNFQQQKSEEIQEIQENFEKQLSTLEKKVTFRKTNIRFKQKKRRINCFRNNWARKEDRIYFY